MAPAGYSDSYDHFKNFFASVRSRKPVVEDAVFGYRAAGAALLSNLSIERGAMVELGSGGDETDVTALRCGPGLMPNMIKLTVPPVPREGPGAPSVCGLESVKGTGATCLFLNPDKRPRIFYRYAPQDDSALGREMIVQFSTAPGSSAAVQLTCAGLPFSPCPKIPGLAQEIPRQWQDSGKAC